MSISPLKSIPHISAQSAASSVSWVTRSTAQPSAAISRSSRDSSCLEARVHALGRLVQKQQLRFPRQQLRQSQPLALAAGKIQRIPPGKLRQPETLQVFRRSLLTCGILRKQHAGILRKVRRNEPAPQLYPSGSLPEHSADHLEQRRFTAAVAADDRVYPPRDIRSDAPRSTSGAFLPQPTHSSLTETSGSPEGTYCFPAFCACSARYSRQTALLLPSRTDTGETPLPPAARNIRCEAVSAFSIG